MMKTSLTHMALCNSRSQTTRGFCYGWYHLGGMELLCVAYYFGRKKGKKLQVQPSSREFCNPGKTSRISASLPLKPSPHRCKCSVISEGVATRRLIGNVPSHRPLGSEPRGLYASPVPKWKFIVAIRKKKYNKTKQEKNCFLVFVTAWEKNNKKKNS